MEYQKRMQSARQRATGEQSTWRVASYCELHGKSIDNKEARDLKIFTMNIVNLNFGEALTREPMKSISGGHRECYCGGGLNPWSCTVYVNDANPQNCTQICAETDCGESET